MDDLVALGARPVQGDIVCLDASQRDLGRLGDLDAEDGDEFGDGLPQREPCSMKQPVWCQ